MRTVRCDNCQCELGYEESGAAPRGSIYCIPCGEELQREKDDAAALALASKGRAE